MADSNLLVGEASRTIDDRYRLTLPPEMVAALGGDGCECLLAKERPGCLSLWPRERWQAKIDQGTDLVRAKIAAGRLDDRLNEVQTLGRLLSTRHRYVPLAGRGRLVVPDSFREFLGVEPGGEAMVVGAAVCVELWSIPAWNAYIGEQMPAFNELFDRLAD